MEGMVVQAGELGADLADVGVLQVLEDGERLLPGLPGPSSRTFALLRR